MLARERRTEAVARVAVIALALLAPVMFAFRAARIEPVEPKPQRARASGLVVVTTSSWPARTPGDERAIGALALRAARIDQCYSPSRSSAGAAASLWTGRYPVHHGITSSALALPAGTWTLAHAAQSSGSHTAAFLEEPFVSGTGIGGFDTLVEQPDLGPARLAELAAAFLAEHAGARTCVWLHLERPGPGGRDVADLLQRLDAAIAEPATRFATMWLVTAFASTAPLTPPAPGFRAADAQARVPLWAALPSGMNAGYEGHGSTSLVDVAGTVCELLGLPQPGPNDELLHSDGRALWRNLSGGGGYPWIFLEDELGPVLRFGKTRVALAEDRNPFAETTTRPYADDGFAPAPADLAPKMIAQYELILRRLGEGAPPPVPH